MKLLVRAVAEQLTTRFLNRERQLDHNLITEIAGERDKLLVSANKLIVFLFTTITIIAIVLFGAADEKVIFIGITIKNPNAFAFIAFLVGNVFYVVSTGLLFKIFVCEYMILIMIKHPLYEDGADRSAFLHCYHANTLSYLLLYGIVPKTRPYLRAFLMGINIYAKYYILVLYGIYYYITLGVFLERLWNNGIYEFFVPLVLANVLSVLTSFAVFCVLPPSRDLQTQSPPHSWPDAYAQRRSAAGLADDG